MIDVGPSGISRLIGRGMPYVEGTDDHGRFCKFIDPAKADAWRALNLQPKIDGNTGKLRGAVAPKTTAPKPRKPPPADGAVSTSSAAAVVDDVEPHTPQRTTARPASPSKTGDAGGRTLAEEIAAETQMMRLDRERDITATARLRRLAAEGKLIDRELVLDGAEFFVGSVVRLLDRVPADFASKLAAELGVNEHKVYLALQRMTDGLRSDLAGIAARERDRAGEREVQLPEPDTGA